MTCDCIEYQPDPSRADDFCTCGHDAAEHASDEHGTGGLCQQYSAPGMPPGAPGRAQEIAETMPTVGQWPGPDSGHGTSGAGSNPSEADQ